MAAMQILRSSVRPLLTYALAALYAWCLLHPGQVNEDMLEGLYNLNLISFSAWYGERAARRFVTTWRKK